MQNGSMTKDTPTMSREEVLDRLNGAIEKHCDGEKADASELMYCSWPEAFGSTCGPFSGIGGQAVTSFRMEAWAWDQFAVVFCNGRIVKTTADFRIGAQWRDRS